MKKQLNNFAKIAAVSFLWVACSRDPREPGYHIKMLSDMTQSVAAEAYSESHFFKDGKTMQMPPEGTVARGHSLFPYKKTDEEAERAGRELANPLESNTVNLERGRFVYENFCLACHGPAGDGDGQLIPRYPNPPSFVDKRLMAMPDGQMFHSLTLGRRDMPAHATQLSVEDRWRVILYVRELQKSQPTD